MKIILKMFIREVVENIVKDGVEYPIDTMQYGDEEYKATLEKYKSPDVNIERSFREIKAAFDNAKSMRLKYLQSQFGVRLEELAEEFEIENLDTATIKKVMLDAVNSATLKIACYPKDLTPYMTIEGESFVFDPVWKGPWRETIKKLGTGVAYAFTYDDSIYVPPPRLEFDSSQTLLSASIDVKTSTLEHEFVHIEDHAIESVVDKMGIVSPNQLSVDLISSALLMPSDLTFATLTSKLSTIPRLLSIDSKESLSEETKNAAMCAYLLYLASEIARNAQNAPAQPSEYEATAKKLVDQNNIDDKLDNSLKGSAKNHGTKGHVRVSLLFMRDSLTRALDTEEPTSKKEILLSVSNDLKRSYPEDTVTRCVALLAIADFNKFNKLTLVATADTGNSKRSAS